MSDDLLVHFIAEARDLTQSAADDLLALEHSPGDTARIDSAFRALHTMKGSVGLFDLAALADMLHAAEDLLGAFRDRHQHPDRPALDALLDSIGSIDGWLDPIAETGRLPPGAEERCTRLVQALRAHLASPAHPAGAGIAEAPPDWLPGLLARDPAALAAADAAAERLMALRYIPDHACFFRGDDPLAVLRAIPDLRIVNVALRDLALAARSDPFTCNLIIECVTASSSETLRGATRFVADQCVILPVPPGQTAVAGMESSPHKQPARTLRVEAGRVDVLADLVGELVVAKNRLAHLAAGAALPPALHRTLADSQADIDRLAGALQHGIMRLRMVRLDQTFRRLPHVVRETAARLGKSVQLRILGGDIEADKSVVDALYDPLLHILRNAIDHGIEEPALRAAAGKPATGAITIAARRDGHRITIGIEDDGQGIDPARVRRRAIEKGLIADAPADDEALLDLIFTPGFSTAGTITETSGRGVGLDVVRGSMTALGGQVTVSSTRQVGTALHIILPIAVAVTSIVVVRAGGDIFGVPFEHIVETTRLSRSAIRPVNAGQAFVLRGRTVPLLSLATLLGCPQAGSTAEARVLVIDQAGDPVGIEVEGFAERMDVVLRPITGLLAGMRGAMGTALLGDGRVLIVLRLAELV
jgi:two-component system chemotaxis sensor kinase CheA